MERPKEMALLNSDSFSSRDGGGGSVHECIHRRDRIEEVDFFSENRRRDVGGSGRAGNDVSPQGDTSITGLHLLTMSPRLGHGVEEEKKLDGKLAMLQGELNRVGEENRRLKIMLDQFTVSYGALHNQYILAMQQRAQDFRHGKDNKTDTLSPVAVSEHQFMEPGQTSVRNIDEHSGGDDDEQSQSLTNKIGRGSRERGIIPFTKRQLPTIDDGPSSQHHLAAGATRVQERIAVTLSSQAAKQEFLLCVHGLMLQW